MVATQVSGVSVWSGSRRTAGPAIRAAINRNLELARALRIDGTPGFVIGEQIVRGAVDLDTMERFIREAREKT